MRKTVTLWANSPDDLQLLQGALQQEFGNTMAVTQEPTAMAWRNEQMDHETFVGYTARVTQEDHERGNLRYISKIDVETDDQYSLSTRMQMAVEGVSEGRQQSIVNSHSVSFGKPIMQLVQTDTVTAEASGPADPSAIVA